MKRYAIAIALSAWIVLCGFQQPSAQKGKDNQKSTDAAHADANAAQPKPLPVPPLPASNADAETNGIESHGKQNIQVVSAAPEQSVDPIERIIGIVGAICTLALVIVGICGIRVALRTLEEMRRQREEMGRQVQAALLQLGTMNGQLTEMSQQTASLKEYVGETRDIASATKKSADAFINAERAWVMVDVTCEHGSEMETVSSNGDVSTGLADTTIKYKNTGHSPGWITEKVIKLAVLPNPLPKELELDDPKTVISELEPISPDESLEEKQGLMICPGRHSPLGRTVLAIYGRISYRDIFDEKRETWFCYRVEGWKNARRLSRMEEYPEYNRNT
jgi:hypothetical protein